MQLNKSQIENQFRTNGTKADLFEDICKKLEQKGIDLSKVKRADISGVDEFHVRGAEVSNELVNEIYLNDTEVLDVGCGLGGPSRMLADRFNCKVTGVDLSEDYINTAQKLSELVGQTENTTFIQADALKLPFEDASFDVVWTQHVQMNIKDKTKFYTEIHRVLRDEGALVYYDIFKKGEEEVNYPLPWANNASINFLEPIKLVDALLNDLGFIRLQTTDQTLKAKQYLLGALDKIKKQGPSILGLNLLMGKSTMKKLGNTLKGIEEKKIELQSGIFKKKTVGYK
jgi:ubiquinone/menaquinone biosynthesis C-methylase UbiE